MVVYNIIHMKHVFLTSSPTGPLDGSRPVYGLDEMNDFTVNLHKVWKENSRVLMIAAFPDAYDQNNEMCDYFREHFLRSGFTLETFDLCDYRYIFTPEEVRTYDAVILSGGHVPTENRFFTDLCLREAMEEYDGIVIGISAGSMNAADLVYAQPEMSGESSWSFARQLDGLNLTKVNIVPHYQQVKDQMLDGRKLFEDITYADSYGRELLCLEDGSYVYVKGRETWIYGRSFIIKDGKLSFLQDTGCFCLYEQER